MLCVKFRETVNFYNQNKTLTPKPYFALNNNKLKLKNVPVPRYFGNQKNVDPKDVQWAVPRGKEFLYKVKSLVRENRIYKYLNISISKPDLVIYLQADSSTLINRIINRGIDFEQNITEDYLKKIIDSYTKYFYSYNESPILIINTSSVDVNNANDYNMLVEEISKDIKGKNYFNPSSLRKG